MLNLGHTFGHTLEAETGFSDTLLHGESVGLGICMAFDLSAHLGLCSNEDAARVRDHYAAVGLPTRPSDIKNTPWDANALLDHMLSDKKVENGKVTFILAKAIGESFVARDVDMADARLIVENAVQGT